MMFAHLWKLRLTWKETAKISYGVLLSLVWNDNTSAPMIIAIEAYPNQRTIRGSFIATSQTYSLMRHKIIFIIIVPVTMAVLAACKSNIGSGPTSNASLQTSFASAVDELIIGNELIQEVYALCLENGALRAQYHVGEGAQEDSVTFNESRTFAGKVLSPIVTAIITDDEATDCNESHASIDFMYDRFKEGMKNMFPEGDCLIPSNLSLPAEKSRAIDMSRQGLCYNVYESDICSAYDCLAHEGSAYIPYSDYNAETGKRTLCSKETAAFILQSLDAWELSGNRFVGASCLSEDNGKIKAILVGIYTVNEKPITIYLSMTFKDDSAISCWPESGLSLLDKILLNIHDA